MKVLTLVRNAVAGSAIALAAASPASAEKWDMALAYAATNFHSEAAAAFAAEVTEKSGGKLEIVTHPGGSLFGGAEIYGAVRRGLAPIGERLISALGNEDPLYEADSIPFLATGFDGARKLYDVTKPALMAKLDQSGLVFLYACPWPPQGFYSIGAVEKMDDLKGLKFRAYNATTSKIAELLGMSPTKIEAAELSQAFATGLAQSMISSGSTGYDRKLWEHVKYFYDVEAWLPKNMVFVNADAWGGLDADTQKIVRDAAASAEAACWAKSEELAGWYLEQFKEQGMTVGTLNADMAAAFKSAGDQLKAEWLERAGESGAEIVKAFESK